MLAQRECDAFATEGYVVRRGALTAAQVERYAEAVDRVVLRCEAPGGYADVRRGQRGQLWGVNNILHPDIRERALLEALGEPSILGVIAGLVGPELQHHLCTLLVSPPGMGYDLQWHRDTAFADDEEAGLLAMLRDHVQLNGALRRDHCLSIVPGSHRRRLSSEERAVLAADAKGDMPGQVVVALEAGDVAFYNSNLLHRGACAPDDSRQTLHYAVHAYHDTLPATLRDLFANWIRCG